jgi:hypothetical protein
MTLARRRHRDIGHRHPPYRAPETGNAGARPGVWSAAGNETARSGHHAAVASGYENMPVIRTLDELTELVERSPDADQLYVRWSRGPAVDLIDDDSGAAASRDSLTGVPLPGLSANPLAVEPWWNQSVRLWVARRLYDYRHLRDARGPGVKPWVLVGDPCGRGPDNEPLVRCRRPVAWIADPALLESQEAVEGQGSVEWGPLDRRASA